MIGGAYHDEAEGQERGRTAFMSLEVGGLRLLHLGDLGHRLDTNLLAQCRGHQVLLIPVGGFFTIDGETAATTMDEIGPSIAIPMHYRTARLPGHPTAPLDETGIPGGARGAAAGGDGDCVAGGRATGAAGGGGAGGTVGLLARAAWG